MLHPSSVLLKWLVLEFKWEKGTLSRDSGDENLYWELYSMRVLTCYTLTTKTCQLKMKSEAHDMNVD